MEGYKHLKVIEQRLLLRQLKDVRLLDEVNSALSEGFEVIDIIPILERVSGSFGARPGVYARKILFV